LGTAIKSPGILQQTVDTYPHSCYYLPDRWLIADRRPDMLRDHLFSQ